MSTPADSPPRGIRMILWFEIFVPGIFFILFMVLACITGVYWGRVHAHPELFEPPYSSNIKPGTYTPFVITLLGVALFLLSICIPHSRLWWISCVVTRLGIAMGLVASVVFQSRYLPLPLGSCKNYDVWRDPNTITEGLPTMFQVLPTYRGTSKSGRPYTDRPCDTLLMIWRFEISLAVLTGVVGLFACVLATYTNNSTRLQPAGSIPQWLVKPFNFPIEYFKRMRGRNRRNNKRKEAEANLLATDPESLEYIDHEMGIRVRPV